MNASTQNQALSALVLLYRELTVRDGKGGKDRCTLPPASQCQALQEHFKHVRRLHQQDLAAGWGAVALPYALARKYRHADRQWGWQWVFPQRNRWQDAATGHEGRHHLDPSVVHKGPRPFAWCKSGGPTALIRE